MIRSRWVLHRCCVGIAILCLAASRSWSQVANSYDYKGGQTVERPFVSPETMRLREFPLLSMLESDAATRRILAIDPALREIHDAKMLAISGTTCNAAAPSCELDRLMWSQPEIDSVKASLIRLWKEHKEIRELTATRIVSGGQFTVAQPGKDADTLALAWEQCAKAMNHVVRVYALGESPRYPLPDSISFDPKSAAFQSLLKYVVDHLNLPEEPSASWRFFEPSTRLALRLLDLNGRDEAGRLFPLSDSVNRFAIAKVKATAWSQYPYTAIVVPGASSPLPGVPLGVGAKLRSEMAAQRFRERKAPFIIVSGGFVHPAHTPYSEALEMKRYLHEVLGVPEDAILVDPYARHTTTNLRNAAREVFEYGMPLSKPLLVVTDQAQSENIGGPAFKARCLDELGYMPILVGKRVSATDLEIQALKASLRIDPLNDPLDP